MFLTFGQALGGDRTEGEGLRSRAPPNPRFSLLRGPATRNATRVQEVYCVDLRRLNSRTTGSIPDADDPPRQRRADVLVDVSFLVLVHVSRCRSSGWRPTNPVRSRSCATGAGGPR